MTITEKCILASLVVLMIVILAWSPRPTLDQQVTSCRALGGEPRLKNGADGFYLDECWLPR